MVMRGKIIVIEGSDCSGKETQTCLLTQRLKKEHYKIERIAFPNYDSPTGMIIGGPYLGKNEMANSYFMEGANKVDPKVSCLYYAADRRYNMDKINELVDNGIHVILDRYVESNMAHQGGKIFDDEKRHKLYEDLAHLEYDFLELPKPDLTFLLYVPYEKVIELLKGRSNLDDNEKDSLHLRNAEKAYLELSELHNYTKIDCVTKDNKLRDVMEINEEMYEKVIALINEQ